MKKNSTAFDEKRHSSNEENALERTLWQHT
jgi:hypothetical protein